MKHYKKSSFSGNGGCVHVAIDPLDGPTDGVVWVKDEWGNECQFDFGEWAIFVAGVRNNEFDVPAPAPRRYTVANRGAVWAIHDNERIMDVSVQALEWVAQAMCDLLNDSLRDEQIEAAISRHPAGHKDRMRAALTRVQAEDGEILKRLGEA